MKTKTVVVTLIALACASTVMAKGDNPVGDGPVKDQKQVRDQLQTCTPDLEKDCTRLKECLPEEVQEAVKDMTQERLKYQEQLKEKQKVAAACTDEQRAQLREKLRDQQVQERAQLRERLQLMRECLPTHDEVMEQAKESGRQ
jgi:hypothetical protein